MLEPLLALGGKKHFDGLGGSPEDAGIASRDARFDCKRLDGSAARRNRHPWTR
jgi:hypothetical protein